jgi:hypothetical protein
MNRNLYAGGRFAACHEYAGNINSEYGEQVIATKENVYFVWLLYMNELK